MKCQVKRCSKQAKCKGKCRKHYLREYRELNPIWYAYHTLKDNAKRRMKAFDLTFEEFQQFAVNSKYLIGKGRNVDSLHIDRIDEAKGYTIDNLQVLTNSENVKKYLRYSFDANGKPYHFVNEIIKENNIATPF